MKVNGYNDAQFKDYYFGGFSFDHSTGRMGEDAPAYQRLKAQDGAEGNLNEDGSFKEGFGPGTKDWEGRLLALKGQSFAGGSSFRTDTLNQLFKEMEGEYKAAQLEYQEKHPDIATGSTSDGGTTYEAPYLTSSRLNSGRINTALKSFDINDLQSINTPGYEIIEHKPPEEIRKIKGRELRSDIII